MIIKVDGDIALENWCIKHMEGLLLHANSKSISKFMMDSFPYPYTKEHAANWINYNLEMEASMNFAIVYKGECIGAIGSITKKDIYRENIEIGYWISEKYQRQGIVKKSLEKYINYCFASGKYNRIEASIFSNNKASLGLLKKLGFKKEALMKEAGIKLGKRIDIYLFRLLKSEFTKHD